MSEQINQTSMELSEQELDVVAGGTLGIVTPPVGPQTALELDTASFRQRDTVITGQAVATPYGAYSKGAIALHAIDANSFHFGAANNS
jgi:hypothetical protein